MLASWQQPLWGSINQVGAGGGPAAPSGSSFIFYTRLLSPITSGYENVPGIGSQGDGDGGFIAPADLTLKSWSDRVTRSGGYRVATTFGIRINGGAVTDLATIAIGVEGYRVHDANIAITEGDHVELLYNCGNNFNMGVALGFFFEDSTVSSSGGFWVPAFDTTISTSAGDPIFGDGAANYNVWPIAPVTHIVRKVTAGFATALLTAADVSHTRTDAVERALGSLAIGETSGLFDDVDIPVLKGERALAIKVKAAGTETGVMTICQAEIPDRPDAPNRSLLILSDSDSNAAQKWHTGVYRAPAAGTIKELSILSNWSLGSFVVNVTINGVQNEVYNGAITGGTPQTNLPNLAFVTGDEIEFEHDGSGLTGGGVDISVIVEMDAGVVYESPVWSAPATPIAGGDSQDYNADNYSSSTSSNATKGNIYLMREDRVLTAIRADSNTTSQTYKFIIAELDDAYLITAILHDGDTFLTTTGYQEEVLDTPILLEEGKMYAMMTIRTDVAQVRMDYDRSPVERDPNNNMIPIGTMTFVGSTWVVTDDVYYETTSTWDMGVTTEKASLEGKFNYWSILMEGSADGLAHSLSGIELRASAGGANLIGADDAYASAYDDIADLVNLFDADNATVWEITDADFDAADRRLVFAMTANTVQEIVLTSDSGANFDKTPTAFKLQFSEDGLLWNDAHTVTGEAVWTAGETRTYTRTPMAHGSESAHRYWAVLCLDNTNGQTFLSMTELEMRESIGGANVATSGQAIEGDYYSTMDGSKAFDANTGTYWQVQHTATRKNDRWVGQDFGLGNDLIVEEIAISARSGSQDLQTPTQGIVMYSDDGTNWSPGWIFGDNSTWAALEQRVFSRP